MRIASLCQREVWRECKYYKLGDSNPIPIRFHQTIIISFTARVLFLIPANECGRGDDRASYGIKLKSPNPHALTGCTVSKARLANSLPLPKGGWRECKYYKLGESNPIPIRSHQTFIPSFIARVLKLIPANLPWTKHIIGIRIGNGQQKRTKSQETNTRQSVDCCGHQGYKQTENADYIRISNTTSSLFVPILNGGPQSERPVETYACV